METVERLVVARSWGVGHRQSTEDAFRAVKIICIIL